MPAFAGERGNFHFGSGNGGPGVDVTFISTEDGVARLRMTAADGTTHRKTAPMEVVQTMQFVNKAEEYAATLSGKAAIRSHVFAGILRKRVSAALGADELLGVKRATFPEAD